MKGFQLRLTIDESVKPVIQPPRRIPFSARAVVEEKLKNLEKQDIIEKIDELTVWLSPIHIVKQLDKVRMVVDMSIANKAIKGAGRGGVFIKIISKSTLWLFLIEGSDI